MKPTTDYINLLKIKSIAEITREIVEEGLKILRQEIISRSELCTPLEFEEMQSALNKLQSRELFALTSSYFTSSKKRHLENLEIISSLKDKLSRDYAKLTAQAIDTRLNTKIVAMQRQNQDIQMKMAQGLLQLDNSLNDLKYFTLLKFDENDSNMSSHEIDELGRQMTLSAAKSNIGRYIGALMVYSNQVKEVLPRTDGIAQLDSPFHSVDFEGKVADVNILLVNSVELLNKLSTAVSTTDSIEKLQEITNQVAELHTAIDNAIFPIADKIKQNMLAERQGYGDVVLYELPREVLDEMGDKVKSLGVDKSQLKEQTTRRKERLAVVYQKNSKEKENQTKADERTQQPPKKQQKPK